MTGKLIERIRSKDTRVKLAALSEFWNVFDETSDPSPKFGDFISSNGTGPIVESLCVAAGDPNFRISQLSMDILSKVFFFGSDVMRNYVSMSVSALIEKLGDSKNSVRRAAGNALSAIMAKFGAPYVFDRSFLASFTHRSPKATLYSSSLPVHIGRTVIAQTAVDLLSDSSPSTRAASLTFLERLYAYCGAELKEWIQNQNIRQSHLKEIMSRFTDTQKQAQTGTEINTAAQKPQKPNQALRVSRDHNTNNILNSPPRLSGKGSQKPLSPPSYVRGEGLKDAQPISVHSERELIEIITSAAMVLDANKSAEWSKRCEAMAKIEGLALGESLENDNFQRTFAMQLREIRDALTKQLTDRRSTVVRHACRLLETLSFTLGNRFEPLIDHFVSVLFKMVVVTVAVIAESADVCIRTMLSRCKPFRVLPRIISALKEEKSWVLRQRCCYYLMCSMGAWTNLQEMDRHIDSLQQALFKACTDANDEVRHAARVAIAVARKLWPSKVGQYIGMVDSHTQRLILDENPDESLELALELCQLSPPVREHECRKSYSVNAATEESVYTPQGARRIHSSVDDKRPFITASAQPNTKSSVPPMTSKNGAKSASISVQRVEIHRKDGIEENGTDYREKIARAKFCTVNSVDCHFIHPSRTDSMGEFDRQNGRSGALRIPTEKSVCTDSPAVLRDRPDSSHGITSYHAHSALGQPGRFECPPSVRHIRGGASYSAGSAVKTRIGGAVRVACNDKYDSLSGPPAEHDEYEEARPPRPSKSYQRQEIRPSPLHTSVKDNGSAFEDKTVKTNAEFYGCAEENWRLICSRMEKSNLSWSEKVAYLRRIECVVLDGDENFSTGHLPTPSKLHQMVVNLIEDPHIKVITAAISCYEVMAKSLSYRALLDSSLERVVPVLFSRLVESKKLMANAASACLSTIWNSYPPDFIILILSRSLDSATIVKVKVAILEYILRGLQSSNLALSIHAMRAALSKVFQLALDKNSEIQRVSLAIVVFEYKSADRPLVLATISTLAPSIQKALRRYLTAYIPSIEDDLNAYIRERESTPEHREDISLPRLLHDESLRVNKDMGNLGSEGVFWPEKNSMSSMQMNPNDDHNNSLDEWDMAALKMVARLEKIEKRNVQERLNTLMLLDMLLRDAMQKPVGPKSSLPAVILGILENACRSDEWIEPGEVELSLCVAQGAVELCVESFVEEQANSVLEPIASVAIRKILTVFHQSSQIPEIQQLAEECAEWILVRGSSNRKSIDLTLSIISVGDEFALHVCFKILGMVMKRMALEDLRRHVSKIMPVLIKGFSSVHADVRKSVVFALVDMWTILHDELTPHLSALTSPQLKLLTIYIQKSQENANLGVHSPPVSKG